MHNQRCVKQLTANTSMKPYFTLIGVHLITFSLLGWNSYVYKPHSKN